MNQPHQIERQHPATESTGQHITGPIQLRKIVLLGCVSLILIGLSGCKESSAPQKPAVVSKQAASDPTGEEKVTMASGHTVRILEWKNTVWKDFLGAGDDAEKALIEKRKKIIRHIQTGKKGMIGSGDGPPMIPPCESIRIYRSDGTTELVFIEIFGTKENHFSGGVCYRIHDRVLLESFWVQWDDPFPPRSNREGENESGK